jgi:hypothetical protein
MMHTQRARWRRLAVQVVQNSIPRGASSGDEVASTRPTAADRFRHSSCRGRAPVMTGRSRPDPVNHDWSLAVILATP